MDLLQVISQRHLSSLSTQFPRCTSNCNTVSLAPFTAKLSGMLMLRDESLVEPIHL